MSVPLSIPDMQNLVLGLVVLVGCGSVVADKPPADANQPAADANNPAVDAPDAAPPLPLNCASYCNEIQTNCTAENAQYADATHCMGACSAFPKGTIDDKIGNTLGCRLYHAGAPSATTPATHCVHAGPGGDKTNVAAPGTCGDACTSFCTLEVAACGIVGDTTGNGQYGSLQDCMTKCAAFPNKDNLYTPTSRGDSLACRLYHITNALTSIPNATTHCPHTGPAPAGSGNPCLAGSQASP